MPAEPPHDVPLTGCSSGLSAGSLLRRFGQRLSFATRFFSHALLVFIRCRAFKGGFKVILTEAATADSTGPSKRLMSSTQQPSAHQTNAAL
jgi:hypothetical protein